MSLPDFTKPFILETDAFGTGIGAVLSQAHHPIIFFSKKLSLRLQRQSSYVREFYAITAAIAKFRHYLLGHKFIIRTDHKSLRSLIDQTIQTPEQQAWLPKFLGYDFTMKYKPGCDNLVADALSRSFFMAISQPQWDIIPKVRAAIAMDSKLSEILHLCIPGTPPHQNYFVQDQLFFWKNKLVLPSNHPLIQQVMNEFHNSLIGGHAGRARTLLEWLLSFIGMVCTTILKTLSKIVCSANKPSPLLIYLLDCSNPCQFRYKFGKI